MLSTVFFRLQKERAELQNTITTSPGGPDSVYTEAASHKAALEAAEGPTPVGTPGITTPSIVATGFNLTSAPGTTSYDDPSEIIKRQLQLPESPELRRRLNSGKPTRKGTHPATDALPPPQADLPQGTSLEPSHNSTPHEARAPSPLAWSSNERIALLARNIDAMEDELRSNGAKGLVWPNNVGYRHFFDYMCIPTLVYQLEYPRTNKSVDPAERDKVEAKQVQPTQITTPGSD
jgi:sterol O-acyltransferase